MNKIMDILIGLGISMFMLVIWTYEMLVTSDIPVQMSFRDSVLISCLLILSLMLYVLYVRKTKYISISILLITIPSLLWFISMEQALIYHYHRYNTLVSIIGFFINSTLFLGTIYWGAKRKVKA